MVVVPSVQTQMASILIPLIVRNIINVLMGRHMSIPVQQDIFGMIS